MSLRIFDIVIGKQSQKQQVPVQPTTRKTLTMNEIAYQLQNNAMDTKYIQLLDSGKELNIQDLIIKYGSTSGNVQLLQIPTTNTNISRIILKNVQFQSDTEQQPSYTIPGIFSMTSGSQEEDYIWKNAQYFYLYYNNIHISLDGTFTNNIYAKSIGIYANTGINFVSPVSGQSYSSVFVGCNNLNSLTFNENTINQFNTAGAQIIPGLFTKNSEDGEQLNKLYYKTASQQIDVISQDMDGYSGKTITKDTYANYDTIDITSP